MSRISSQKRSQTVLAAVVALAVGVGLWSSLIRFQQQKLQALKTQTAAAERKSSQIQDALRHRAEIEAVFNAASNHLAVQEQGMASGDLYESMVETVRKLSARYSVDVPQFSAGATPAPVDLLPKFPYQQATIIIGGTAFYHDLGRFIAEFENQFPYSRVQNLELMLAPPSEKVEKEKLLFRMEIVSLIKPGSALPPGAR